MGDEGFEPKMICFKCLFSLDPKPNFEKDCLDGQKFCEEVREKWAQLQDEVVVFAGALSKLSKKDMEKAINNEGGTVAASVTSRAIQTMFSEVDR